MHNVCDLSQKLDLETKNWNQKTEKFRGFEDLSN